MKESSFKSASVKVDERAHQVVTGVMSWHAITLLNPQVVDFRYDSLSEASQPATFVSTKDVSETEKSAEIQRERSPETVDVDSRDIVSEEATGDESSHVDDKIDTSEEQELISPIQIGEIQALFNVVEVQRFHEGAAPVKASKLKCKKPLITASMIGAMFMKSCFLLPDSNMTDMSKTSPGDISEPQQEYFKPAYEKSIFPQTKDSVPEEGSVNEDKTSHLISSDSMDKIQTSEFV